VDGGEAGSREQKPDHVGAGGLNVGRSLHISCKCWMLARHANQGAELLGRHRMSTTPPIRTRLAVGAAMTGLAMTGAAFGTPTASAALTPTPSPVLASFSTTLAPAGLVLADWDNHGGDNGDRGRDRGRDRDRGHFRESRCHSDRWWDNNRRRWNWDRCDGRW
jgi:hypothetical protein